MSSPKRYPPADFGSCLRVSLWMAGLCLSCGATSLTAHAQPEAPDSRQVDQRDYEAMLKEERRLETTDLEAALTLMQKFGQNHPTLDAGVRATLLSDAANLAFDKLHDKDRALKIATQSYNEAKSAVENGASDFLLARAVLVKGRILMSAGQTDDAEALVGSPENWKRYALLIDTDNAWERSYAEAAVGLLLSDLEISKRPALAATKIEELMRFNPALAATNRTGIVDRMAGNLLQDDKAKVALGWAKLSFMLANFDNAAIETSTRLLARAWASSDDLGALRDFTKAQRGEADAKNPLQAVALPALVTDAATQEALKKRAVDWEKAGPGHAHDLISVYLLTGSERAAMERAQDAWRQDPQGAAGAQEVGRVFKAVDLDTTRGNAFIAYVAGTSDGPNPLKEFFKEHPADKAAN